MSTPSSRRPMGSAGLWLASRDIVHLVRRGGPARAVVVGYPALVALLVLGGFAAHGQHRHLALTPVLTTAWLLWAVLPAVGAGGGNLDAAAALAPYPVRERTQLAAAWFSALLDVQYLLLLPVLLASAAADAGPWGLAFSIAFAAGASGLGQLAGWLGIAGARARRGQSLAVTAVAVLAVAAWAVARGGARRLGSIPPDAWYRRGVAAAHAGRWPVACGWWLLLAGPVLLVAVAGPALVRRATVARLAGPSFAASSVPLRAAATAALAMAAWRGMTRTLSWRATLLSVVAVPFLAELLAEHLGYRSLACVVLVSAGATLGANTWAYEAGGIAMLLSAPVARRRLVLVRSAVLAGALAATLVLATVAAVVAGQAPTAVSDAGFAACALTVVTAAAMRTAAAAPSAADVDSLRSRPTSVTAVLGFGLRCLLGLLAVSIAWHQGPLGAAAGTVVAAGYATWSLRGTRRVLDDGAGVLAAFATTR